LPKKTKRKDKRRKSKPRHNPKKNHKESMWKKITVLASSVAGLDNIAGSAMKDSTGQPIGERAKNFINALVGKKQQDLTQYQTHLIIIINKFPSKACSTNMQE